MTCERPNLPTILHTPYFHGSVITPGRQILAARIKNDGLDWSRMTFQRSEYVARLEIIKHHLTDSCHSAPSATRQIPVVRTEGYRSHGTQGAPALKDKVSRADIPQLDLALWPREIHPTAARSQSLAISTKGQAEHLSDIPRQPSDFPPFCDVPQPDLTFYVQKLTRAACASQDVPIGTKGDGEDRADLTRKCS